MTQTTLGTHHTVRRQKPHKRRQTPNVVCVVCVVFVFLLQWWVPNVVCVVCGVVFVQHFLPRGGCPILCRVCSFCRLTVWWVPNVVCVSCVWVVFVFLLCGGCPMLKTKTTHTTQTTLGTQCCHSLLTVWWVPNVVCVVCVVFVVLLRGGCPTQNVNHTHDTDNIGHPPHSK